MARRQHITYADEYLFLKSKVEKIMVKSTAKGANIARLKRQAKKFVKRMLEIEQLHKQMGWPHPESIDQIDSKTLNEQLRKSEMPEPRATLMPDGSLPETKITPAGEPVPRRVNPDGTLVQAEMMEGSDPRFYSEDQVNKFFNKTEDTDE